MPSGSLTLSNRSACAPPGARPTTAFAEFSRMKFEGAVKVKPRCGMEEPGAAHHAFGWIVPEGDAVDGGEVAQPVAFADARPGSAAAALRACATRSGVEGWRGEEIHALLCGFSPSMLARMADWRPSDARKRAAP